MRAFEDEYNQTTKKMADTVMEYAAQFVARGYLDEYKKAAEDPHGEFVPGKFDEMIYKKISKEMKWYSGRYPRLIKRTVLGVLTAVFICCLGLTIFAFATESIREAVFAFF